MFFLFPILILFMLSKDCRVADEESNAELCPALPGTHRAKGNTMDNTSTSWQGSLDKTFKKMILCPWPGAV